MTIGVRWGSATDAGRVRELNEDSLLAEPPLFVVADGVGGHAAGEVASGIAVTGLGRFTGSQAVEASSVLAAVQYANTEIREHARSVSADSGMGSTIVGLALSWAGDRDTLLVFNVGDSRALHFTGNRLEQVSRDHSLVDELVRGGHISAEEASVHPQRSVITRALGASDSVEVDSWHVPVTVGDRFVLCSDGLTNEVDVAGIEQVLGEIADPQAAAQRLIELALDHGGRDNVTAVVVDITSAQPVAQDGAVFSTVASPNGVREEPPTLPLNEVEAGRERPRPSPGPSARPAPRPSPGPSRASDDRPTNPVMPVEEAGEAAHYGARPAGRFPWRRRPQPGRPA